MKKVLKILSVLVLYYSYSNAIPTSINTPYTVTAPSETLAGNTVVSGETGCIIIPPGVTLFTDGYSLSLSSQAITTVYGTIQNGSGTAGTININSPSTLALLGGTLTNGHASSVTNVYQGGTLNNYYGTVNLTTGGAASLNVRPGGFFNNVRGNNPGSITLSPGSNFTDNDTITLNQNLELDYTWTITQQGAVIFGLGNKITFSSPEGGLKLQGPNASLLLDNIILENVSDNNIRLTDNTTSLSLHNVIWNLNANYSFTKGSLYITGDWLIQGKDKEFSYATDQTSTLTSNATMHLLLNTFKYNSSTPNQLYMYDSSSVINLDNATLQAVQNCTLSTGKLFITGFGTLQGDATLNVQGITDLDVKGSLHRVGTVIL